MISGAGNNSSLIALSTPYFLKISLDNPNLLYKVMGLLLGVNLKYRLESFELQVDVDPNHVGTYNKSDELYTLYTRSTDHITINPEIVSRVRNIGNCGWLLLLREPMAEQC